MSLLLNIREMDDSGLFSLRILVDQELARRGVSTKIGDLGEWMAINHFNNNPRLPSLLAAPKGAKNIDAVSRDGDRYSIKSIQKGRKTGTVYPAYRDQIEIRIFEYILIVFVGEDFQLKSIYRLGWDAFVSVRSWDSRMNAFYLGKSRRVLEAAEKIF